MDEQRLEHTANLLLDIASTLMVCGANTGRVTMNIDRFASVLHCKASSLVSHRSIVITLKDKNSDLTVTKVQSIPTYSLNFSIISSISKASWRAVEDNWELERIETKLAIIKKLKKYPKIILLFAVSLAGAGFCNIFNGDAINMITAFISTFAGLTALLFAQSKNYNPYISIFVGSFIASIMASLGVYYNLGLNPQTALATSILFLVPGVPLINSVTDLFDNNVLTGMVRFTTGLLTVLAMSLGLFLAMLIFQFN